MVQRCARLLQRVVRVLEFVLEAGEMAPVLCWSSSSRHAKGLIFWENCEIGEVNVCLQAYMGIT